MNTSVRRYMAEGVGTFVLVLVGCGSAILAGSQIGILGISIAFGLAVMAMIYAIGPISGCHINPAVTFALLLTGKFGRRDVLGYVIGQLVGGIAAGAVLMVIARGSPGIDPVASGFACTGYEAHSMGHYSLLSCFFLEVIFTAILVLTILGSTDVKAPVGFAGLAIGMTVTMLLIAGIPVTGASLNPARSIATAVFEGGWALQQLWLFIVAPLMGSALAALVYETVRAPVEVISERHAVQATRLEQADRFANERHEDEDAETPHPA